MTQEFYRILKPGGLLICSCPNNWALSQYHLRTYDRPVLEKTLSRYFKVVELYNQNSGSPVAYNHDQPVGIQATTANNELNAECYIAVCVKKSQL